MTIYQRLQKIQTKFKSKKSRFNSFGKYYFRSAEDILEATKPYLLELGVSVTISENLVETSPMPIIESCATITDGETKIIATALVGVDLNQKGMQTPQQFGTASSYGKKYALGNLFLIDDTKDADATNGQCPCKRGYGSKKCDQCETGYYYGYPNCRSKFFNAVYIYCDKCDQKLLILSKLYQ